MMPSGPLRVARNAAHSLLLILAAAASAAAAPSGDFQEELRSVLASPPPMADALEWEALRRLYQSRELRQIWHDPDGRRALAEGWLPALQAAGDHGLRPTDYHLAAIVRDWDRLDLEHAVQRELLMSDAFLAFSRDLHDGRYSGSGSPSQAPRLPLDAVALARALDGSAASLADALAVLPPPAAGYQRLQAALIRYRQIEAQGGWPLIEAATLLARGVRDPRVPRLRERLTLSADLDMPPSTEDPYWFDEGLDAAVRRFQSRHGLSATGRVDERTRAALNEPPAVRIRQIAAAMERWRWLPRDLGSRYVEINMADFMLRAFQSGQLVLEKRVVIGRPYRATPTLSSAFTRIVLYPDWTVPHRLAVEDLLPLQQQDAGFLSRKRIRVYTHREGGLVELAPAQVDWMHVSAEHFPYTLRQDPGPDNSLGRIKFVLPNSEDIYLHDTPTRRLFDLPVRVFSAGCVRVEDPLALAEWLLADERWSLARLEAEIASERTRSIALVEPVPVYLVYWTSWVTSDGTVQFRHDVYERDALVAGSAAQPSDDRD